MTIITQHPFELLENVLEYFKIKFSPRFMTYVPNHNINVETKNYYLKTALSTQELLEVFKLRHKNFQKNVNGSTDSYDLDDFDHRCDHLIIKSKDNDEIVGTYRILCSLYTDQFYSQGEFQLDEFLKSPGIKLELGRACIDLGHRNGNVIDLLWKGIANYAKLTQARYLFGCSSISTVEPQMAFSIINHFIKHEKFEEEFNINPTKKYSMDFTGCTPDSAVDVKEVIPSLLKSYIGAGAKIFGMPARDLEFECCDYMTILDLNNLSRLFDKRYFK